jgi:hypothetical protein
MNKMLVAIFDTETSDALPERAAKQLGMLSVVLLLVTEAV